MKNPLITMSAITGKPTKDDIFSYLTGLKENGIEQVMLYPRSGCELEYLSDEWFEAISNFLQLSKSLNIDVWLYDEFNWPSGDAGGLVTKIPEYRLQAITVKGDNIGQTTCKTLYNSEIFGEKYFPNLLLEDATDYFINSTHEKYYEKFSDYFGSVIKGFFTDEPSISYCTNESSLPYYEGMREDYFNKFGTDFDLDMRNNLYDFCGNSYKLLCEKFQNSYLKKLRKWCDNHHILLTGHVAFEDAPFGATKSNCNIFRVLKSLSLPGIDELWTDFKNPELLSLFGVGEYISGDFGAMIELFALGPCDMTFDKKKAMLYICSCFKINRYFLAVSQMDLRGNFKITDYFNPYTVDQPDFDGMKILATVAESAAKYANKDYVADIYIHYPTDICAKYITENMDMVPFTKLINNLSFNGIQWKYIDTLDEANSIPVIDFKDDLSYVFGDIVTRDVQVICDSINPSVSIKDMSKNNVEGIFARQFTDGTVVAINLFAHPGEYYINDKPVCFEEYGVYISDEYIHRQHTKHQELNVKFDLNYLNDNIIRAMQINDENTAYVYTAEAIDVRFAVRKDCEFLINKTKPEFIKEKGDLPKGLHKHYNLTETLKLKNGKNTLNFNDDIKYMPSVFVMGDFEAEAISGKICEINLKDRKKKYMIGEKFCDFGAVEFITKIFIPENANSINIEGTKLYSSIIINNKSLGVRLFSPYAFEIPDEFKGKTVELKILQKSTIAPIYADVDYFDKHSQKVGWKGTPSPNKTFFGFDKICFVF